VRSEYEEVEREIQERWSEFQRWREK